MPGHQEWVPPCSLYDSISPWRDDTPHVVIIGGGFGGLEAARALAGAPVRVTLLDRHNYHLFQPLLYQVATASLSPGDIASPIRWMLRRQKNVQRAARRRRSAIDPAGAARDDRRRSTHSRTTI